MIDDTVVGMVLIDDGKCWRGDDIIDAQRLADCFDESGFSGAHAAVESKYLVVANLLDKCRGGLFNVV